MRLALSTGLLLSILAPAAELARWEATQAAKAQGMRLERAADSPWRIEPNTAGAAARLNPSADYYARSVYLLVLDKPAPRRSG